MTDITGIAQAVQDALEARDRRIAELEQQLAQAREALLAMGVGQAGASRMTDLDALRRELVVRELCRPVRDALEARDRRIAELEQQLAQAREALLAMAEHIIDLSDCNGDCATCPDDEREQCAECDVLMQAREALARGKAQGWDKPEDKGDA